jgi:hypothetical protein
LVSFRNVQSEQTISGKKKFTVAANMRCGRTKTEALIENVLGPKSIEMVLEKMKKYDPVYYGISSDASNKKNRNFFSLTVTFFDKSLGIQ